jgi:Carboxypeptidase regulatory-like domain
VTLPTSELSLFLLLSMTAGSAQREELPLHVVPGDTSLQPERLVWDITNLLGRETRLIASVYPDGEAVWLRSPSLNQIDVSYQGFHGLVGSRTLSVSERPVDAGHDVALPIAELISAPAGSPEGPMRNEIEGHVAEVNGGPVAQAKVDLVSANQAVVESTDTDQLGRFRIPAVVGGNYVLRVRAEGFETLNHPIDVWSSIRSLVLQLQPTSAPARRTMEIEGQVVGSEGEPVAEARLVLTSTNGMAVETTDTDQAGRFRVPEVMPGKYSMSLEAAGYATQSLALEIDEPIHDLKVVLQVTGASTYRTVVQATRAPLPAQDGTTGTTITRQDIENIPGGTTHQFNDIIATQPGFIPDNYGAIHVRGNFAGLQLRVDGIQLPPAIQDRLQQLLDPQIIQEANVIIGGLPAEYGEDVAGVIDIKTRHPLQTLEGESQSTIGTYNHLEEQANIAGSIGSFSAIAAGMIQTTDRGLDPEAASPILHDRLREGRGLLRLDAQISAHDKVELLGIYAESHYQIPIDPTLLPLSAGPANAVRGTDQYGNSAPDFVPYNSNPTEFEREAFVAISYSHDFDDQAQLQVTPFLRSQASILTCDVANQLGATADPGQMCSDVNHQVTQGGLQVNQSFGIGVNHFKTGFLIDAQRSSVAYTQFTRNDRSPVGGADPSLTLSGVDDIDTLLTGIYFQDRIVLGKLTLFPGVRFDALRAKLLSPSTSKWLLGPSVRLGAAYAFTDELVVHGYLGRLWQPPSFDAPAAARILGLVPANAPVPFDLLAEEDNVAEIGISARVSPQLTLSLTPWVRLSTHTLDDNEVGDTALKADYNYVRGRAWGAEFAGNLVIQRNVRAFANVSYQVSQGEGIATSRYLFSPEQIAFTGYQATDNAQLFTANAGIDVTDNAAATHLSGLMNCGSGLRTGPTNNATLPPTCVFNATLRHRFDWLPGFKPEVALDVQNIFNVIYAYRISTGSLAGTAYAPLRQISLRLILQFGADR